MAENDKRIAELERWINGLDNEGYKHLPTDQEVVSELMHVFARNLTPTGRRLVQKKLMKATEAFRRADHPGSKLWYPAKLKCELFARRIISQI